MGKDARGVHARLPAGEDVGRLQYDRPKLIFPGAKVCAFFAAHPALRFTRRSTSP